MKAMQRIKMVFFSILILTSFGNSLGTTYIQSQSPNDLIELAVIQKNRIDVTAHPQFKKLYLDRDFFAEYDEDIDLTQLHPSIALIPFICSVVPIVWASGKTLFIDTLDAEFAQSLEKVRHALKKLYPSLKWSGQLIARQLVKNENPAVHKDDFALLFSGGVDGTCTSLRRYPAKQLLITVWGSDVPPFHQRKWHGAYTICKNFATQFGHDHTYLHSNFCYLFKAELCYVTPEIPAWWRFTTLGLSYCGLAAPIAFSRGYTKMLFSSTYSDRYKYPFGSHPMLEGNLEFGGVAVEHTCFDLNRQEKIKFITNFAQQHDKKPFLRVCWNRDLDGGNCNDCMFKCFQAMNALLIEGADPCEYGFTLSEQEVIQKTKEQFLSIEKPLTLSIGETCRWQDMQERIREILASNDHAYTDTLRDYLSWVLTVDMNTYNKHKDVPFTELAV